MPTIIRKTREEVEKNIREVERLSLRGVNQNKIAEILGIYESQVSEYVKQIKKRRLEQAISDKNDLVREKLEQLRMQRQELWDAWDKSKDDSITITEEEYQNSGENGGSGIRTSRKTSGRLPDSAYIAELTKIHKLESELTGILDTSTNNNTIVIAWDGMYANEDDNKTIETVTGGNTVEEELLAIESGLVTANEDGTDLDTDVDSITENILTEPSDIENIEVTNPDTPEKTNE